MGKYLIIGGMTLTIIGTIIHFSGHIFSFGKLPGDIHIKKENFSIHFPIMTCLILSALGTLIMWLIGKFRS